MERPDAAGRGACRWLCLEWQDLPQPLEDRSGHHRHPLEWPPVLWFARQTAEGGAVVNTGGSKKVRCAIYIRVSTDQGLEQDFNSLERPVRCLAGLYPEPTACRLDDDQGQI